jgi:hypothetical protein
VSNPKVVARQKDGPALGAGILKVSATRRLPVRRLWHWFTTHGIDPAFCVVGCSRSPNRQPFMRCAPSNSATDRYFPSVFRSAIERAQVDHFARCRAGSQTQKTPATSRSPGSLGRICPTRSSKNGHPKRIATYLRFGSVVTSRSAMQGV